MPNEYLDKNPALGGKTVTPYENENQNENSLTVKL